MRHRMDVNSTEIPRSLSRPCDLGLSLTQNRVTSKIKKLGNTLVIISPPRFFLKDRNLIELGTSLNRNLDGDGMDCALDVDFPVSQNDARLINFSRPVLVLRLQSKLELSIIPSCFLFRLFFFAIRSHISEPLIRKKEITEKRRNDYVPDARR